MFGGPVQRDDGSAALLLHEHRRRGRRRRLPSACHGGSARTRHRASHGDSQAPSQHPRHQFFTTHGGCNAQTHVTPMALASAGQLWAGQARRPPRGAAMAMACVVLIVSLPAAASFSTLRALRCAPVGRRPNVRARTEGESDSSCICGRAGPQACYHTQRREPSRHRATWRPGCAWQTWHGCRRKVKTARSTATRSSKCSAACMSPIAPSTRACVGGGARAHTLPHVMRMIMRIHGQCTSYFTYCIICAQMIWRCSGALK